MSKITRKGLRKTALKLLPAIYDSAMRTGKEDGLFQHEDWRTGICLDAFLLAEAFENAATYRDSEHETKLKQLDQSVFDGQPKHLTCAAVDSDGKAYLYEPNDSFSAGYSCWSGFKDDKFIGRDYDVNNWKNSMIKRDKVELTGSDLARVYFANNGKPHVCFVGEDNDECLSDLMVAMVIGYNEYRGFETSCNDWFPFVQLVNSNGKPLTQSDVGL